MSKPINPETELEAPDRHTAELARLEKMVADNLDGWKRAKADYLNLKKQSEKDQREIAQYAQAAAVMEFLPVYDNLKRSLQHMPTELKGSEWAKGNQHIQSQFEEIFKRLGLEPIPTVGQAFDPNLHAAVSKVKEADVPSGQIVEELKSGFRMGDRVVVPAQVTVAE